MNDQERPNLPSDSSTMRSPVRPTDLNKPAAPSEPEPSPLPDPTPIPLAPDNPQAALDHLREKMEGVANEYADGKINRAQFNAIYGRYSEQRAIIERLIQRNPNSDAWKQASAAGHTSFLREHFEARLLFYLVYQHNITVPLMMGGKQQPNMEHISRVLTSLWGMNSRPKVGLARKDMGNGNWLVLALGEFAVTLAMFMLEPSVAQMNLTRDLHADFERANRAALERGTRSLDRFVFPQRALAEKYS
ncbi:MAG: hypothetical protein HZC41_03075 [Chloroflexi bacterium]|nr:hypothetical protein [Chloroflexota bacterium]